MNIITSASNITRYKTYLRVKELTHSFLKSRGYLEIDLPYLSPALIPESYLEVFETEFRYGSKRQKLYLTPSPELFLKRLLVAGIGNCYSLGRSFRNADPHATLHSPEFTMLEFYKMAAGYWDIAKETLHLLQYIAERLGLSDGLKYDGKNISFSRWENISVAEAFDQYAGIQPAQLFDERALISIAEKKGYSITNATYADLFSQIYTQEVEKQLGMNGYPTLIYDYPAQFAALAQLNTDKKTAQRFEFYIAGIELGDCYSELTDWEEQQSRFSEEQRGREETGKISHPVDKGFIEALKYGLAPCAGIAIGFDRLAMIFAQAHSISELQLISIGDSKL